ncbi:LamB/YcsF family protein [Evansella clarkii]|uniref:LamB/YcsF family protein n=1 Tax=Evansella clarkii TaxID=79879 RepID=UPI000997777E|nr:5-oxoprolinase subunit PxpA [Evansella clarkii]
MKVDLNCDMGESFGNYSLGFDEEMMEFISSANIACGYHAGDPHVMRKTVEWAKASGTGIGAHPGFPDLIGFGRRHLKVTPEEVKDYITYQMGALREFAAASGLTIQHCKPHGALYMMAMEDEKLARAFLEAVAEGDDKMIVFALNNSAVVQQGEAMGVPVAKEGYADRQHTKDGSIVLTRKSAMVEDNEMAAERVVRMVKEGKVTTHQDKEASITVDTVCIHGDTPNSLDLAKAITEALKRENISITSVKDVLGM